MSRSKKSRKPGGAPTAKPKLSKQELANVEKRIRKTTGKVAGNRQKEAAPKKNEASQKGVKKDPRIGNKTPIVLGKIATKAEKNVKAAQATQHEQDLPPIAQVRFVDNEEQAATPQAQDSIAKQTLSLEDELNAIEEDKALQEILAKQEDDIALTEQEVDYYNEMMTRHQALSAELGFDDYDDESEEETGETGSEEDLWDKLDRPNFTDYNEKE